MATVPRLAAVAVVLALVLAAAVVVPRAQTSQAQPADPSSVTTTGEATANMAPDVAFVQLAAEGRGRKTTDAQKLAADAMTNLQSALKGLALAPNAVRTTGYTVSAEYDYVAGQQNFRDYLARNTIEVRVDDLTKLPSVIDASGGSGATNISGLRFDLKNRATVERDLLRRAVEDAMARADAIAVGAHRTTGSILKIQEQRISSPTYSMGFAGAGGGGRGGAPTPVEPGEVQVRAQVTLTVSIH